MEDREEEINSEKWVLQNKGLWPAIIRAFTVLGKLWKNALYFKTGWDSNGEEEGVEGGISTKDFN